MSPRYHTNTYLEAPYTLPVTYHSAYWAWREIRSAQSCPWGGKLMAPQRLLCWHSLLTASSPPLLTALFFYHTGNQIDSSVLKPFLLLSDRGDGRQWTSLMQPLSPEVFSWSHLWKKRWGDGREVGKGGKMSAWGLWVSVCSAGQCGP